MGLCAAIFIVASIALANVDEQPGEVSCGDSLLSQPFTPPASASGIGANVGEAEGNAVCHAANTYCALDCNEGWDTCAFDAEFHWSGTGGPPSVSTYSIGGGLWNCVIMWPSGNTYTFDLTCSECPPG
jgi:hypothetical protein